MKNSPGAIPDSLLNTVNGMTPETRSRLLHYLVRFHFAYLITIPLLGLVGWWFIWRQALIVMIASGFAAIAAFYSLQIERYHLTEHLPSALWVVVSGPVLLLMASFFGGGMWFFFLEATFVEVGGMCAGIVYAATIRGIDEREYKMPATLYLFMGGFIAVWGWAMARTHTKFTGTTMSGWWRHLPTAPTDIAACSSRVKSICDTETHAQPRAPAPAGWTVH
jgi:hypothetical protein